MATTDKPASKRNRQGPRSVILTTVALFATMMLLLAARVAAGTDPVLGPPRRSAQARPGVVHRILRTVIVETTIAAHSRRPAVAASPVSVSQTSSGPEAPVTRSS